MEIRSIGSQKTLGECDRKTDSRTTERFEKCKCSYQISCGALKLSQGTNFAFISMLGA